MSLTFARALIAAGLLASSLSAAFSQKPPAAPVARTEPGLEEAVKWKWQVAPTAGGRWGFPIPDPTPSPDAGIALPPPPSLDTTYEVKKGDALVIIARKYDLTAQHLKVYNGLTSDLIHIGQVLRIPSISEARAIAPLPERPLKKKPGEKGKSPEKAGPSREQLEVAPLQAFLDREQFATGPIDGERSMLFEKILHLYMTSHPEAMEPAVLKSRIQASVGDGFTTYKLKEIDFRFIAPPKAQKLDPNAKTGDAQEGVPPSASYDEMVGQTLLAYRTPWEFVAERFHCNEAFLRRLNSHIQAAPTAGTELRVPNVVPFAIESLFAEPLQPDPNPQLKLKAVILDQSILKVFEGDHLIAAMPMSMARPGLRGKDAWVVLNAIPRPRLATRQEPREQTQRAQPLFGRPEPEAKPNPPPTLASEQFLADGPNNPVGVIWINLAKTDSPDPLPYGLHGTSNPDQMQVRYSLGGLQLANWDIARAARLLPVGTILEWQQGMGAGSVAPAARPAQPAR